MRSFFKFTFITIFSLSVKAQVPTVTITSCTENANLCSGQSVTLSSLATFPSSLSVNSYSWLVNPSSNVSFISKNRTDDSLQITFLSGGSYTIFLICGFTPHDTVFAAKRIVVSGKAEALFNATFSNEGYPNSLILTNYSTNSIKNYWVFDHNLAQKDSSFNVIKNYSSSGSHTVTLIAIAENDCNDTSDYVFDIPTVSSISLPNVFTPNNDGVNDVYRPDTKGISKLNAYVYNRNGALMYSWDRIHGFWDGYTGSGQACADGEYFIVVDAEGFDGKTYKLKNAFTLMR